MMSCHNTVLSNWRHSRKKNLAKWSKLDKSVWLLLSIFRSSSSSSFVLTFRRSII